MSSATAADSLLLRCVDFCVVEFQFIFHNYRYYYAVAAAAAAADVITFLALSADLTPTVCYHQVQFIETRIKRACIDAGTETAENQPRFFKQTKDFL